MWYAQQRLERALNPSQRLYLMSRQLVDGHAPETTTFVVMGSSQTITYNVNKNEEGRWICTCPDFRGRQEPCKHVYYTIVNILQIPRDLAIDFAQGRVTSGRATPRWNLPAHQLPTVPPPSVAASVTAASTARPDAAVRVPVVVGPRAIQQGDECGICYLTLEEGEALRYCSVQCGQSVHHECFQRWLSHHARNSSCVHCRAPMTAAAPSYRLVLAPSTPTGAPTGAPTAVTVSSQLEVKEEVEEKGHGKPDGKAKPRAKSSRKPTTAIGSSSSTTGARKRRKRNDRAQPI